MMEAMDHARIFDADAHRMPREALGVGNQDLVRAFAEGCSERFDLRLGGTTTRWRVGFVREEDRVRCHRMPVQAPRALHLADESIDGLRHVFNVETGPVEGGVRHPGPEQFSIGLNATLRCFGVSLHHEGSGSHTEDQAVASPVERQRCFFDDVA